MPDAPVSICAESGLFPLPYFFVSESESPRSFEIRKAFDAIRSDLVAAAADGVLWQATLERRLAEVDERSLEPKDRMFILVAALVGMEKQWAESVEHLLARFRPSQRDDFCLRFASILVSNYLGNESAIRDELIAELAGSFVPPETPPVEFRRPACSQPHLSLALSTWNNLRGLSRLLESVRCHTKEPYEIVVCDNDSRDGTPDYLRTFQKSFPQLGVIHSTGYRTTMQTNRLALGAARGEMLGCLADDLEVTPGWEAQLVDALRSKPYAGAVEPLVLTAGGTLDRAGGCIPYASRKYPFMNAHGYPPEVRGMRVEEGSLPSNPYAQECAAYPFVRRDVYHRIKMYDPYYLHWWGDNDTSLQIRRLGKKVLVCPKSRVIDTRSSYETRDEKPVGSFEEFFADLFYNPDRAVSRLRSADDSSVRFFRDTLLFECKWRAYRVRSCVGRSPGSAMRSEGVAVGPSPS